MFPKPKTERDKAYRHWVASLECVVCRSNLPCAAHHVPEKGKGSKGAKVSDYRCLPLCHPSVGREGHHMEYHRVGRETFARTHDLDLEVLIMAYNRVYERREE